MENKNFNISITTNKTAYETFKNINCISKWWTENIEGSSAKLNDVFTLLWGGKSFVTIQIVEFVEDKKVVWLVIDSYLEWLTNKMEWQKTKIIFEITTHDNNTEINFTHIGLVPQIECYNDCVKGWNQYVNGSLVKLITEGKGQPQLKN